MAPRQIMLILRPLLALAALLALSACGPPMRWEHPALSDAQAQAEMGDCRQQAWSEAQSRAFYNRFAYGPSYVRGRDGRLYMADPWMRPGFNNTWFEEQRLRDFCLRNKGFRLVPGE
ncbi:hypothetical protein B7O87_05425 [Cylindrospermopsis raciborskii CENA303]|uniref:Uncharacterized protein n=1 Tax=Cylindrospermopsis raciborskii CENA303 TaxID=1170769 RepID=A0A1X4G9J2_9CYAN|nr:hypothetical protein B7O87_05425 [Cylindrospermopsis raciborskii CENA303]